MYAIVDIETTGGYHLSHRITEIAVLIHDGKKVVDKFQSLINPEQVIPSYITSLTGINNQMVENAPKFYEVAKDIMLLTKDCVFVAHSVNFDYSFIRQEYKSLGGDFTRKKLCTVRMSRKIFPGFPSYSLGNLCQSLGIKIRNRHRAFGDAEATVEVFERLLENDSAGIIQKAVGRNSREATLPPHLPSEVFEKLPEDTGVYYFHDAKGKVIYVGKAVDIKKRVISHFTGSGKRLSFMDHIHDITFTVTGSELIALLLESDEIKKLWPIYNQAQKRTRGAFGLFAYHDQAGVHRLQLGRMVKGMLPLATFNSFESGRSKVFEMIKEFELCPACCGMQKTNGACFDHQVKKCKGVCASKEKVPKYNKRVAKALKELEVEFGDLLITDEGRTVDEKAIVGVEKGVYKGFGYVENEVQIRTVEEAADYITDYQDNTDVRRIIRGWTDQTPPLKGVAQPGDVSNEK